MIRDKNYVGFFVPSLHIGGVESVFLTYASMLVARGYKVDFVVCKPEGALLSKVPVGVRLIDFKGIKLRKAAPHLRAYLKQNDIGTLITGPDITNFLAILVNLSFCTKRRVNLIVTQHSVMDNDAKNLELLGKVIPLGKRILYRFASSVIAVSDAVHKDLIDVGVPTRKLTTIYNPISIESIDKLSQESCTVNLPNNYVAFVGRLYDVKNVGLLIKSFSLLNDENLHLVIVGDGAMMDSWQKLAKESSASDRIIFTGSLTNPAPAILGAMVIAVPSFSEAFPMVVIEAAALGKTIAHTPNLGCVEILGKEYSYCSQGFDDAADFANVLRRALECPIEAAKMKRLVKKLDESEIIPQLEVLIFSK